MSRETGVDGCATFSATIQLDDREAGRTFEWGVMLLRGAGAVWAVPTEVKERDSQRQHRLFTFAGREQWEEYYLTHCRRLGANKRRSASGEQDHLYFAVWAPNAKKVRVVVGTVWDAADPENTVLKKPIAFERLSGGYISDKGVGISVSHTPIDLKRRNDGVWESGIGDAGLADFMAWDHLPYMYEITRDDDSVTYRTDLFSRCQIGAGAEKPAGTYTGLVSALDGTVSCSVVVDPESVTAKFVEAPRVWPEREFIPELQFWRDEFGEKQLPSRVEDLIIYELHVGALGFGRADANGRPSPGTLQDAIAFLDHIADCGVNAIELLPMSEFGEASYGWGYSTSHYFAVEFSGGGRDQFKFFIKAAHQRGIAVIIDVVYNHYAHEAERAQCLYDSPRPERDIYYWYEGKPEDYSFSRGGYVENQSTGDAPAYHEEMVRKLFISSAVALVQEFHVDGFRVDQTTSIHNYNRRRAGNQPVADANIYGAKLLREFGRTLRLIKPSLILIAEDHSSWAAVTQRTEQGGMGFDARWHSEFYHHLIGDTNRGSDTAKLIWVAAAFAFDKPALAMERFARELEQSQYQKVMYSESHDEAGNSGGGPFPDPEWNRDEGKQSTSHRTIIVASNAAYLSPETRRYAEARCRFAYGLTALSAGTPMFLFGEEVGAEKRYKYHGVVTNREDYRGMRYSTGANMFSFYRDVNLLRRRWPGLRSKNIVRIYVHDGDRVLAFSRWEEAEHFLIVSSLNDTAFAYGYAFRNNSLWDGAWREIFNSDSSSYGGENIGNKGATLRSSNGHFECVIPANGLVVFQRVSD